MDEKKFIESITPKGMSPEDAGIEPLADINKKLQGIMPEFTNRGMDTKEYTILGVEEIDDYEGIVKVASVIMIPPGEKKLSRKKRHIVVGDALPRVVTPIILKNGSEICVLLCAQDRMTLGGKVSIEVYRGSVPKNTANEKLGTSLVERKLPGLKDVADLLEIRNLGYFWNNTGISGVSSPVQALFYVCKKTMTAKELKSSLKLDHSLDEDPKTGPILPATETVVRTLEEVRQRLDEIANLSLSQDKAEAYLNDLFSMTALFMLLRSLDAEGLPF